MTDTQDNKQGQGGGPKTVLGKVSSSKNAIKHGVTSQRLLNPTEEKQYQEALTEFSRAYDIQHPLIDLQIKRIAQTQIQLQRIQKLMDVQFQKSQLNSNIDSELQKEMHFDENTSDLKLLREIDPDYQGLKYLAPISVELLMARNQDLINHELVLNNMPHFIDFILQEARGLNQNLYKYIQNEIRTKKARIKGEISIPIIIVNGREIPEEIPTDLKDILAKFSQEELDDFLLIKQLEIYKAITLENKINDFQSVMPLLKEANLPDLNTYDKLMRYQTNLNNQLSKQIGELLELEKRYAK